MVDFTSGQLNHAEPLIMHIDLNSCFATIEQQARPRLRGRPVVIVNRRTEQTMIVTASYEAKALGIGLGMKLAMARQLVPDLVALESDPPKYRYVYHKLMSIMNDYSANVRMKSIDEGVIDFHQAPAILTARGLSATGYEIKQRLKDEIGCAMRCNVGIGPNRFLAKTAAGLNKPDGLEVIQADNLRRRYGGLRLTDLTGIAQHNRSRLNLAGITTPLEFLDASEPLLRQRVFRGIVGTQWYARLRGFEVDQRDSPLRSAGRQYVLEALDLSWEQIMQRLHHLSESVGRKIRSQGLQARGVTVYARTYSAGYWQARSLGSVPFFSNQAIYRTARALFEASAPRSGLREIGVTCYKLIAADLLQLSLLADDESCSAAIVAATDDINSRYGERTIHAANTLGTDIYVKQKIPFGSTRYL